MSFIKPVQDQQVKLGGYTGPTNVELDPYATHWDRFGVGGLQSFETLIERDAIKDLRRQPGMLVWVEETQDYYRLALDRLNWVVFTGGGGGGDKTFTFTQAVANTTWNVVHNLGKSVSVTVVDTGNTVVEGEVIYNSLNDITIIFSAPFTGSAFCN
ncbi:MAG: hypothetical protein DRI24_21120 [Deltaproteobacteria bacterium]|nr:MAG: hypothetical protein DRI24_21120 [Deltaproteobacteria bacterium]